MRHSYAGPVLLAPRLVSAGVRAPSASPQHPLLSSVRIADDTRLNDQPPKNTGKKVAPAPGSRKGAKIQKNPLFESRPKNVGIGTHTRPWTSVLRLMWV